MRKPALVSASGIDPQQVARQWDALVVAGTNERVRECMALVAPLDRIAAVERPGGAGELACSSSAADARQKPFH